MNQRMLKHLHGHVQAECEEREAGLCSTGVAPQRKVVFDCPDGPLCAVVGFLDDSGGICIEVGNELRNGWAVFPNNFDCPPEEPKYNRVRKIKFSLFRKQRTVWPFL